MEKIVSKGYVSHVQRDIAIIMSCVFGVVAFASLCMLISDQVAISMNALTLPAGMSIIFFNLAGERPL